MRWVASLVIAAPVRRAAAGNRPRKRRMLVMPRMTSVWMSPISRTERRQQWRLSRRDGPILIILSTKEEQQQATRTAVGSWIFMGYLTSLSTRSLLSIKRRLCRRLRQFIQYIPRGFYWAFVPQRERYSYEKEKQKKTKILHSEIPPPKVPFRAAQCLQRTLMPLLV